MKHILFSLSVLLCTYSLHLSADQIADDLTDLEEALLQLEQVITNQPAPIPTQPLTPTQPAPTPTKPLIPLQPMPTPTQPLTPLVPPTQPIPAPTQPATPLIPIVTGPTMEQQIQTSLDDLDTIQMMLNNFKTIQQPRSIPLSDTDLDTWQTELTALSNDIQFLKANTPSNADAQTKIIAIKDSVVDFLNYLKTLALTKNQATTLLQYIDEFYTNGIAQPDYQTLLGDMSTSNATIEQLKNDLYVIIQTQTNLDDLDTIQMMLNNFKTVQQPRIIPLSATDLDTWRTELTALKNDIQFFKANTPDNIDAQTKIIAIKDSVVEFLAYLKTLALTENQANTLLQYIDEFYTNGVAQPDHQALLGNMSSSNATIEQRKNDLNAIINPVTPLVPVPAPEETQPLTPLVPTPEETQPLTPLVPAPTQPSIPTTPVIPDSFKPAIARLMSNIQLDQPRIQALFDNGDTDTINTFMTKITADLRYYAQSFSDYSVKISSYYKYLTDEQKQLVVAFLNSIQTGLGSDGMKTLPNLPKAQSNVTTLLQKINP